MSDAALGVKLPVSPATGVSGVSVSARALWRRRRRPQSFGGKGVSRDPGPHQDAIREPAYRRRRAPSDGSLPYAAGVGFLQVPGPGAYNNEQSLGSQQGGCVIAAHTTLATS